MRTSFVQHQYRSGFRVLVHTSYDSQILYTRRKPLIRSNAHHLGIYYGFDRGDSDLIAVVALSITSSVVTQLGT